MKRLIFALLTALPAIAAATPPSHCTGVALQRGEERIELILGVDTNDSNPQETRFLYGAYVMNSHREKIDLKERPTFYLVFEDSIIVPKARLAGPLL